MESKRSDKRFPMTSIQLSQYVGGELAEAFPDTAVDVHDPELTVHVEVRDLAAYVHSAPVPGAGGMPVGSNGSAVTLLSGGIDSPVSSYMIAKRGVRLIPVHFWAFPYTGVAAKEKVIDAFKDFAYDLIDTCLDGLVDREKLVEFVSSDMADKFKSNFENAVKAAGLALILVGIAVFTL